MYEVLHNLQKLLMIILMIMMMMMMMVVVVMIVAFCIFIALRNQSYLKFTQNKDNCILTLNKLLNKLLQVQQTNKNT